MLSHYLQIVEDRTIRLHTLTGTVLQSFETDAKVKTMLDEGLTGRVETDLLSIINLQLFCQGLDGASNVRQKVLVLELVTEVEATSVAVHVLIYEGTRLWLDGERYAFIRSLHIA